MAMNTEIRKSLNILEYLTDVEGSRQIPDPSQEMESLARAFNSPDFSENHVLSMIEKFNRDNQPK